MSLTDEDKRWIAETLRSELQRFATKEDLGRFATKEDLGRCATKEDLGRFATKDDLGRFATKEDLEAVETKLLTALHRELERFATKEDLEAVETKLLTAFHEWASPMEVRVRSHSAVLRALDADLDYLTLRFKRLEDKQSGTA